MELYQLEYLCAVSRYKTILKAAEELNVSQPSITKAIKKLEDEFGFPLFDREKNRLILNDCGKEAVRHAGIILEELENLKVSVNNLYQMGMNLNIGTIAPAPIWGIESLSDRNISQVLYDDTEALLDDFRKHKFTMIILDYPINHPQYVCRKICSEQLYIAVNKDHVLADRTSVTFEDINGFNFLQVDNVGYWYELSREHLTMSKILVQNDPEAYRILCGSTDLPIFRTNLTIPYFRAIENKVYIPISDEEATLTFYAVYHINQKDIYDPILSRADTIDWAAALCGHMN